MKKQVLTPEEMEVLIDAGLDVSSASWEWYSVDGENWSITYNGDENVSWNFSKRTFDLSDILDILPKRIGNFELELTFMFDKANVWYNDNLGNPETSILETFIEDSPLQSAYQMLLWCIKNKHIKTNNK